MSKFISRLTLNKKALCVLVDGFAFVAPGGARDYENISLEIVRGKARKILVSTVSAGSEG